MPKPESTDTGRKMGPLSGVKWSLSTPNTVAIIGVGAVGLLIALRQGFRPINIS
jgi:hypothetical protein